MVVKQIQKNERKKERKQHRKGSKSSNTVTMTEITKPENEEDMGKRGNNGVERQ